MSTKTISLTDENGNKLLPECAEDGYTSNGYYIKFADGTLICYVKTSASITTTTYGSLNLGQHTWTFPKQFYSDYVTVFCSQFKLGSGASWGTVGDVSKTSAVLRCLDISPRTNFEATISAIAIGRWK